MIIKIISKCLCNAMEFTKAFNLMLALHGKISKLMNIIKEGTDKIGLEDVMIGTKLSTEFELIMKDFLHLVNSRKTQFIFEANEIYKPK